MSRDQLIDYLALTNGKKLDFHNPERRFILPRTFVLRPGLTMLLGRLGRLDVIAVGKLYVNKPVCMIDRIITSVSSDLIVPEL